MLNKVKIGKSASFWVCLFLLGALLFASVLAFSAASPTIGPTSHDVRPGYGVTDIRWLSEYHRPLAGTVADTKVYVLQSSTEGPSVLLLGGTHPNEVAGQIAATVLIERGTVTRGTIYDIPFTNNSAVRYNQEEGGPQYFYVTTSTGQPRYFHVGSRLTQPEDQCPDPKGMFFHPQSNYMYPPAQARNLNRNHPGLADGTLTQQVSYALFQLVKQERIDVVIDMHEAPEWSALANGLICNPKNIDVGADVVLSLEEAEGITLHLEESQPDSHGLSHREFGDRTDADAFLIETGNPSQGDPNSPPEEALGQRVYYQLATVNQIVESYGVTISWPFALKDLEIDGVGAKLR